MADVFVSYKAEDRPRVAPIVAALQQEDLSVWWDAHVGGGEAWREAIQIELDAAKCVIVVWSNRSVAVEGRFVRDEATRAERRNVYLPVRIDPVEPPLGFGEVQALDLIGWKNREDPRWQRLIDAVRAVMTQQPRKAIDPYRAAAPVDRRWLIAGGGDSTGGGRRLVVDNWKSRPERSIGGVALCQPVRRSDPRLSGRRHGRGTADSPFAYPGTPSPRANFVGSRSRNGRRQSGGKARCQRHSVRQHPALRRSGAGRCATRFRAHGGRALVRKL